MINYSDRGPESMDPVLQPLILSNKMNCLHLVSLLEFRDGEPSIFFLVLHPSV